MTEVTALFGRDGRGCRAYRVRDRVVSRPRGGRLRPALSAHLSFVDDSHFAKENGAERPRLLPLCYRSLLSECRASNRRRLFVTAVYQVGIDAQRDRRGGVAQAPADGQNVNAIRQ